MKEYVFLVTQTSTVKGIVSADSEEEAKKKILNNDYDDIIDETDCELKEVIKLEEI